MAAKRSYLLNDEILPSTPKRVNIPDSPTSPALHQPFSQNQMLGDAVPNYYIDESSYGYTRREVEEEEEIKEHLKDMDDLVRQVAEKHERNEERKLNRALVNEKYRLLDTFEFPLTKTAKKFITVGVKPLENYIPILRLGNIELTAAAWFTYIEAREFFKIIEDIIRKPFKVTTDTAIACLKNYMITLHSNNTVSFNSRRIEDDVYTSLYLALETLKTVSHLEEVILKLMDTRCKNRTLYPDYDQFVTDIAGRMMNGESASFESALYKTLNNNNNIENNLYLFEIALKLPCSVENSVNNNIEYYKHYNNW